MRRVAEPEGEAWLQKHLHILQPANPAAGEVTAHTMGNEELWMGGVVILSTIWRGH
ncbi:hypothetical protein PILCRDRAFT_810473 [Piloderma croceum F 1598]|uniref:Uncharacterized protein n=1 Tax=Piloderma croceum (strain F 1598) TaxID=765440 RepID=A0A0C3GPE1_PILCF|nr:hypothetical protein PILCRDRAFT_810473 [Piloderma croceum F 1598]